MHAVQDDAGNRGTQDAGYRYTGQKERNRLRLFSLPKPVAQVEKNAREITRFGQPKNKARNVQLMRGLDEARQRRNRSPGSTSSTSCLT